LDESSGDDWGAEGNNRPANCGRAASGTPLGTAILWDTLHSAAELSRLIEAANSVCEGSNGVPELVVLRRLFY
jgi:hypothetical protein